VAIKTIILQDGEDMSGIGYQTGVTLLIPEQVFLVEALAGQEQAH
jgi:hypothetical protein